MPISIASSPLQHSNTIAAAAAGRASQSLPQSSKLLDAPAQSQPARLTLPPRSSATLQSHSTQLQHRQMMETNRQSALFSHLEQRSEGAVPEKNIQQQRKEHARLGLDINNLRENADKAKTVGVDVAKKTFYSKMVGLAVSALATSVVVGLAVASGGVGLVVAAGIAGLVLAKQAADTRCAQKVLQNERSMAQGQEKRHNDVPMGADWVANKMYALIGALRPGKSEEYKMRVASQISTGVNITLAVASVANGGVTGALAGESLLLTVLPASISVANVGIMHFLGKATANTKEQSKLFTDENMLDRFIEVNEKYNEQINDSMDADYLDADDLNSKKEALLAGVNNLENDFDTIALRMEEKDLVSSPANLQVNDDEDLAYVQSILNQSPREYAEDVAVNKYEQAIAKLESAENADKLYQEAQKDTVKKAALNIAEMVVEKGVEKAVEKGVHALTHAEVDVDVGVMAAFTSLAMLKSAYDLHSAVKELNQVKAPIAKHEQNIAQINRQFEYII